MNTKPRTPLYKRYGAFVGSRAREFEPEAESPTTGTRSRLPRTESGVSERPAPITDAAKSHPTPTLVVALHAARSAVEEALGDSRKMRSSLAPHDVTAPLHRISGAFAAPPLVLVVDDVADTRELYAEYLRFAGFRVEEADNGEVAVRKAAALHPDIVLMDYAMPIMDGVEAARRLRADTATRAIPIIMLTGFPSAAQEEREHAWEAVLEKPSLPEDVSGAIRTVLHIEVTDDTKLD